MTPTFATKDSGERREFETGARRDVDYDKPHYALIDMLFKRRLAELLTRGAKKYSDNNWRKGMPLSVFVESLERHLEQAKEGLRDEDHLAAVGFNLMCWMWTEAAIDAGVLPKHLDDLYDYLGLLPREEWLQPYVPYPSDQAAIDAYEEDMAADANRAFAKAELDEVYNPFEASNAPQAFTQENLERIGAVLTEALQGRPTWYEAYTGKPFPITPETQHPAPSAPLVEIEHGIPGFDVPEFEIVTVLVPYEVEPEDVPSIMELFERWTKLKRTGDISQLVMYSDHSGHISINDRDIFNFDDFDDLADWLNAQIDAAS